MNAKQLRLYYEAEDDEGYLMDNVEQYLVQQKESYIQMSTSEKVRMLISEENWAKRHDKASSQSMGVNVRVGDICFIDFGKAYVYEAGFQHFGFILSLYHGKAFVIPMTSNPQTYSLGYHPLENPQGKQHLLRIGKIEGLTKPSVLFVNDAKFINTARVIDVKAHIEEDSELFHWIHSSIKNCIGL